MKLVLTALIDFNDNQESDQGSTDVSSDSDDNLQSLIDSQALLTNLARQNSDTKKYQEGVMSATLRFTNLDFRQRYLDWIYTSYSDSITNRRRIQQNERAILVKWARQFNRYHDHLKIMAIKPNVNDHDLTADLTMISFSYPFGRLSFDFRSALETEYHQNYDDAFYHLEADEGHRFAKVLGTTFIQYVPDTDFQFVNQNLSPKVISKLEPVKFNPEWISQQQQKSESASSAKSAQLQRICNSVLSSADSRSATDAQLISKLRQQLRSASNERTSLINANKLQMSNTLSLQANSMSSAQASLTSISESASGTKQSLTKQLVDTKSYMTHYSSLASVNALKFEKTSQHLPILSSANSACESLRSESHRLSDRVNTLKSASLSTGQSFASNNKSLRSAFQSANRSAATADGSLKNTSLSVDQLSAAVNSLKSISLSANRSSSSVKSLRTAFQSFSQSAVNVNESLRTASQSVSESTSNVNDSLKSTSISASQSASIVNESLKSLFQSTSTVNKSLKATSLSTSRSITIVNDSLRSTFQSMSSANGSLKMALSKVNSLSSKNTLTSVGSTANLTTLSFSNSSSSSESNGSFNDDEILISTSTSSSSSVKYASDYNFSSLNVDLLSNNPINSMSFAESAAAVSHNPQWKQNNDDLDSSVPKVRWAVIHKRNYIPLIIIISIIIVIALIFIFPILRF